LPRDSVFWRDDARRTWRRHTGADTWTARFPSKAASTFAISWLSDARRRRAALASAVPQRRPAPPDGGGRHVPVRYGGAACVIDLRSTAELKSDGRGRLAAEALEFHHLPLFDGQVRHAPSCPPTRRWPTLLPARRVRARPHRASHRSARRGPGPAVVPLRCRQGPHRGLCPPSCWAPRTCATRSSSPTTRPRRRTSTLIIERLMASDGYQADAQRAAADTLHARPETMVVFLERITGSTVRCRSTCAPRACRPRRSPACAPACAARGADSAAQA